MANAKNVIDIKDAVFSLRPHEVLSFSEERPASPMGTLIGVALVSTPDFPGLREEMHRSDSMRPFAVVACWYYEHLNGWGFLGLDHSTKQAIGDALIERNAASDRWYWIDVQGRQS